MKPLAGMEPFYTRFPDLGWRETRTMILPMPQDGIPAGEFGFIECYCNAPHCDCRRVLLQVRSKHAPQGVVATINYGWESADFYTRWMHGDAEAGREIAGASLDPLNPNSEYAPALLGLFRELLMTDKAYVARLRRHYKMFRRSLAPDRPGGGGTA